MDETLPHRFGAIGQETTGPGGFAKALRTVPARPGHRGGGRAARGAPGGWILDFTNPVGIVTQALLDAGHRAIGLCNVAIGFQRGLAAHFGVDADRVRLDHVGLNHLSWIRARARRRRGPPAGAAGRRRPDRDGGRALPARAGARAAARSRPTTCASTTRPTRRCASSWTAPNRAQRRHGDRARAAGAVPGSRARPEAGAPGAARRRLLQRGGRRAHRVAPHRRRRHPRRERAQRRGDPRAPGRRRGRAVGTDHAGRGRAASRPTPLRTRCGRSCCTPRSTSGSRSRRR